MNSRIKVNSRVSTEAWRFDKLIVLDEYRWSYKYFDKKWRDSRVIGSVVSRSGDKWVVKWDLDGETNTFESSYLQKELDETPKQKGKFNIKVLIWTSSIDNVYY